MQTITGKDVIYYNVDMLDKDKLNKIFKQHQFSAVMHFAGLKSVSESVAKPMEYYEVNLGSKYVCLVSVDFQSSILIYALFKPLGSDQRFTLFIVMSLLCNSHFLKCILFLLLSNNYGIASSV